MSRPDDDNLDDRETVLREAAQERADVARDEAAAAAELDVADLSVADLAALVDRGDEPKAGNALAELERLAARRAFQEGDDEGMKRSSAAAAALAALEPRYPVQPGELGPAEVHHHTPAQAEEVAAVAGGVARRQRRDAVERVVRGYVRAGAPGTAGELVDRVLGAIDDRYALGADDVELADVPPLERALEQLLAGATDTVADLFVRNLVAVGKPELRALEEAIRSSPAGSGAGPLGARLRQRLDEVTTAMLEPMEPAELRDVAVAVAALGAAVEDLDTLDGRLLFSRADAERWTKDLQTLLEAIGEPPGHGDDGRSDLYRAWWPVREGLLDELVYRLGEPRRELEGGDGIAAELDRTVEQLRDARDEARTASRAVDRELERERRRIAGIVEAIAKPLRSPNDTPRELIAGALQRLERLERELRT